jgi:hypothetical protein
MTRDAFSWTKINKGDRRPQGRVLVAYAWQEPDFIHGDKITYWGYTSAWWNAKRQYWVADYGKPIGGVTHWMPLPDDPSNNHERDW